MADQHYYLGIDLGTTNSSVHWGALNPQNNMIEPKPLEFDQMIHDGRTERHALLPSFIFFKQGDDIPVVGEYARSVGRQGQPSRVAYAVKNHMGRDDWNFEVDGRRYSASDLSSLILRTLLSGIRSTWGFTVEDVCFASVKIRLFAV